MNVGTGVVYSSKGRIFVRSKALLFLRSFSRKEEMFKRLVIVENKNSGLELCLFISIRITVLNDEMNL